MFIHFLITRFNLRTDRADWMVTKMGEPVLTDQWLAHRFQLFERYCFPSVKNQVCQRFIWFLFFDSETPENYKQRILSLTSGHQNFIPVFVDGDRHFYSTLCSMVREHTLPAHQYVITTRVDNDDCLNIRCLSTIQEHFHSKKNGVIDIIDGYQMVLDEKKSELKTFKIRKRYNAFISLIETAGNPETVMSKKHGDWRSCKDVVTIKNDRLWLQLIHDKNLKNALSKQSKATRRFNAASFGLASPEDHHGSSKTAWMRYFEKQKKRLLTFGFFRAIRKKFFGKI